MPKAIIPFYLALLLSLTTFPCSWASAAILREGEARVYTSTSFPRLTSYVKKAKGISSDSLASRQDGETGGLWIWKRSDGATFLPLWQDNPLAGSELLGGILDSIDHFDLEVRFRYTPDDLRRNGVGLCWDYSGSGDKSCIHLVHDQYVIYRYAGGVSRGEQKYRSVRSDDRRLPLPVAPPELRVTPKTPPLTSVSAKIAPHQDLSVSVQHRGATFRSSAGEKAWEGMVFRLNGQVVDIVPAAELDRQLGSFGVLLEGQGTLELQSVTATTFPAVASVQAGDQALNRRQFDVALSHFRPLAVQGHDPEAQLRLGSLYLNGIGVDKDPATATDWLKKAAGTGLTQARIVYAEALAWGPEAIRNLPEARRQLEVAARRSGPLRAEAEYRLGRFFAEGLGGNVDYAEARAWLEKAVSGPGFPQPQALFALGMLYGRGLGIPRDFDRARELFERGAGLGDVQSMLTLGTMYANGEGVKVDLVRSHQWFSLALDQLPPGPQSSEIRGNLGLIESRLAPTELERARQLATDWRKGH